MEKELKNILDELRPIRDQLAHDLEQVDLVRQQFDSLKLDYDNLKQAADQARAKDGDESPEYSRAASEQKALGPELERVRVIHRKAIEEATRYSRLIFESHVSPLIEQHFAVFYKNIGKNIQYLFESVFEAERIAINSKPALVFRRCISDVRRNFESPTVDETMLRHELSILDELLSKKPNFAKFWNIKEKAPY